MSISFQIFISVLCSISVFSIDLTPVFYFTDFHPIPLPFSFLSSPAPTTILYVIPYFPILHPAPSPSSSNRRTRPSHLPPSRKPTPSKNPLLTHPLYPRSVFSFAFLSSACFYPFFFSTAVSVIPTFPLGHPLTLPPPLHLLPEVTL